MKLVLDFDRVLFDNVRLQESLATKDMEHLFAEPELWDHLSPADFLYDDTIPFLTKFDKSDLYIVTAYTARIGPNAETYQARKLADSNIAQYVQEVIVMDGPKSPYITKCTGGEAALFVDDKRKCVEEVDVACSNVSCVQLLRPGQTRTKFDVEPNLDMDIPVVANLGELDAIINSL